MATGIIADVVWLNGLPVNGAVVNAYKASRFSGIPAENAAPPVGGADAGPVTSATTFGGEGAFQITVPTQEAYYLSATYGGVTVWQYYSDSLTAGGGGVTIDTNAADIGAETSGAAASAGAIGKAADAGHVHAMPALLADNATASVITASAPGDTKVAGANGAAADAAHRHQREAWGTVGQITEVGAVAAAGATGAVADAGHVHSGLGQPLALTGATSPTRYCGATTGGAPATGTFAVGDFVIDQTGAVWVCTVAGSPGTWIQIGAGVQSVTAGVNVTITGTAQNPIINAAEDNPMIPTGYWYESMPRFPGVSTGTLGALTSGDISAWAVTLIAGSVLQKIAFVSGTTAAVTPTHQWFVLYDASFNALAVTADDGATAWGTTSLKPLSVAYTYAAGWSAGTSYTIPSSGLYYVGIMVAAATVPTLIGSAANASLMALPPVGSLQDTAHTGQTTPNTSPASLTNSGTATGAPYFLLG